ncbi:MAG: hypothetical protein AAF196_11460 [Planctomycetota bacterium]
MDPRKLTRRLPWIGLGLAIVGAIVFFARYAAVTVLVTTVDEYPAGTTCIVDRWSGDPEPGQILMIELGGQRVLTRVERVEADSMWILHEEADGIASGAQASPIDSELVIGALVSAFAPDQAEVPSEGATEPPSGDPNDRDG